MAQVSYGTITITDTNDIESIYMEYAQSTSNQTAPTSGWDTDIPTWQQGYYIWQRTVTKMSGVPLSSDSYGEPICLTGSTGSTGATGRGVSSIVTTYCNYGTGEPAASYSGWQSTVPTYDSTKPNYWVKTVITYTTGTPATDTTIYKDNGITNAISTAAAANATAAEAKTIAEGANSAISDLNQYFWRKKTASTNVPAGSYVTNIPGTTYESNPANGGFNSLVQATGIFLRNGITTLSSWTGTALTFNNPSSGNAQLIIGANGVLQSGNYVYTSGTYSDSGTKIDLTNGSIYTPGFRTDGSNTYIRGEINALTGKIGNNSSNYWTIGNNYNYDQTASAALISHGTAFIQLDESNTWRLSTDRIHTAWNGTDGSAALVFPKDGNTYWDWGIHSPHKTNNVWKDKFIYARKYTNTSDSDFTNRDNLSNDLDDDLGYWTYQFYVDKNGSIYARNFYLLNEDGTPGSNIGGQDAVYLLKSGGTMTGSITMSNGGKFIGDLTGNADTATTAGAVTNSLKIQLNSGTTEGTNQFTYNGSTAKNINITKSSIGLGNVENTALSTWAGSSALTTTKVGTLAEAATRGVDTSISAASTSTKLPTSAAVAAFVEGKGYITSYINTTYSLTQDSSNGHKITLTPSSGNAQTITIPDNNTTYTFANGTNGFTVTPSGGTAQTVTVTPSITNNVTGSGTNGYLAKFTGANTIGNGPALSSTGTRFLKEDGTWGTPGGTYSLPLAANGTRGGVQIGYTQSGKNYPVQLSSEKMYVNVPWENTTYSAGSGLSLSGTTFNHSNSVTAGTAGTSSATSGATLAVPYVTYDAQGHITGSGTHTHTINSLSADVIIGGYLNIHPENTPTLIPFMHNDIAHLLKRGGSAIIKYDNTTQSLDLTSCFDGSGSYWAINPTGVTTITIELTLHKVFAWGNTIYVDFGNTGWRAKSVKIELMNSNYTNDTWTQKYSTTTNGLGHIYVNTSHQPVGADNTGGGFNKIRFTFSDWGTSTIFRIAQLGVYNYGSTGLRETYMSRGVDDYVFRSITPYSNNTYNLGSSSNKWNTVYATTLTGTLDGPVKDSGNGTNTTFAYSKSGLTTASWLAAWNNYELRAISPSVVKGLLSLSKSDVGLGNVLNEAQVTGIGSNNGKLRVYKGTNYEDVTVEIVATESTTATTATKLSSYAGTQYQPVYFPSSGTNQGKPVGITDSSNNAITIQKSVPANAVFTDTTYTAGSGLTLDDTQFKHSNSVTAGTISDGGNTRTLSFGGTFKIPSVTYDAQGHITNTSTITLTMPAAPTSTGTADAFSSAATVALTGDTTGSASSTKGWSITTKTDRISTVGDNRAVATTPNDYVNKIIFQGLKTNSSFGSPSTDSYSYVVGLRGWSDSSGGNSHEFAFNNSGINHRSGATTSWGAWEKLVTSSNYTDYTVTKTGSGASGTWGINITGSASSATNATNATNASNLMAYAGNEVTIGSNGGAGASTNDSVWFNYRDRSDGATNNSATQITNYYFGNRKGGVNGVIVNAAIFKGALNGNADTATSATSAGKWTTARNFTIKDSDSTNSGTAVSVDGSAAVILLLPSTIKASLTGNASTATTLQTSRSIFGKSFNGGANVAGQALVYGDYTATASSRYAHGGLQIREQDLVGSAQSDILYAPTIGFHWSGRIAASLIFHSDGNFYLRKQDGVTRATLDANLNGNATTATTASKLGSSNVGAADRPIYLSTGTATQTTYRMAGTNATATTALGIDTNLDSGIWYVNGTSGIYSQSDGVAIVNKYSDSWITQIYQDYRTGQIALRGKNNGTWQAWRKVLDSSNYTSYMGNYVTLNTDQTITASQKTFTGATRWSSSANTAKYGAAHYDSTLEAIVFSFA